MAVNPNTKIVAPANRSGSTSSNLERLERAGEVGAFLAHLYSRALPHYPIIDSAIILPSGASQHGFLGHTGGGARYSAEDAGLPEVVVNTGDGWSYYRKLMFERRGSANLSAKLAGWDPYRLTPEALASFIFFHELGHTKFFLTEGYTNEEYEGLREEEMKSLPWPGWDPVQMKMFLESEAGNQYMLEHIKGLMKAGIFTAAQLLEKQEVAYHLMPTESYCDEFAADVLRKINFRP